MATKEDMIPEIAALALELGIDVETEGLSSRDLSALLSDLKAKKRDADTVTQADDPPPNEEPVAALEAKTETVSVEPEPEPVKEEGFFIEEGRSLTSKKGILGEGAEVKPEYLSGGIEAIESLVKSGHIVKK